jgi:autotransporter translocation and assembly factor TamB
VLPPELGGEAALDLRLRGPFSELTVLGDVAVAPLSYGPISADGVQGLLRVGGGIASVEGGQILLGAGKVSCEGTLDFAHDLALDLRLQGRKVPLVKLAVWGGVQAPIEGAVDFTGRLHGTIDRPLAEGDLRLAGVSLAGVPFGAGTGRLAVADGVVSLSAFRVGPFAATVAVDVLRREARVDASLASFGLDAISPPLARLVGGALDCTFHGAFPFDAPSGRLEVASALGARGFVEMDREGIVISVARPDVWRLGGRLRQVAGGYGGDVEFEVSSSRQAAHDLLGDELPIDGDIAGHADVTLVGGRPARIEGIVTTLDLEAEGERATLQEPARFLVEGGAVTLTGARLLGPHSSLFVRASRREDGTLSGNVAGQVPASLLSLFFQGGNPHGNVELLGEILGTDREPRFEGVARVERGSLTVPGLPGPLTGIEGVFEIVPEVVALSDVKFQLAGGEGSCDGRIIISPDLELDLTAHATRVRWPLQMGFTPILQGDVRIVGTLDNLSVSGETALQRTVYRRELSLQRLVVEGFLAPVRSAPEAGAVNLNVHVVVPSTLELAMPIARLSARGDLRLVGTSARPGLLGRLEVLPGGELEMNGVRYELDRATVTFTDPNQVEPFFDVLGHTSVQNWDISVAVVGTLERLTPTFSSTPPLPEMDIISLLSTGRRVEQVGQVQAGAAASSFLTEQLAGAVTNRARSLFSLDQLSVDPVATSDTGNPTARLTVAKQFSRDWVVTVSTTLASNREEVIVSRWRLAPGLFLEATRDTDGSYSMDVKWQRRY